MERTPRTSPNEKQNLPQEMSSANLTAAFRTRGELC